VFDNVGEEMPGVDASTKLVASGLAEAVVFAGWPTVRWNVVRRNEFAAFDTSECRIHGAPRQPRRAHVG
jgi:hypothetical protein